MIVTNVILFVILMSVECGDCEETSETSQWQGSAVAGGQIGDNSTGGATVKQGDKSATIVNRAGIQGV